MRYESRVLKFTYTRTHGRAQPVIFYEFNNHAKSVRVAETIWIWMRTNT